MAADRSRRAVTTFLGIALGVTAHAGERASPAWKRGHGEFVAEFARENRDKYRREGHPVEYVEIAGLGHLWTEQASGNETIGRFFANHPRGKVK